MTVLFSLPKFPVKELRSRKELRLDVAKQMKQLHNLVMMVTRCKQHQVRTPCPASTAPCQHTWQSSQPLAPLLPFLHPPQLQELSVPSSPPSSKSCTKDSFLTEHKNPHKNCKYQFATNARNRKRHLI